ncbi:MAG: hypothetical protein K2G70_01240 [Turicibacter sp.]|nr:hypothetical protein [Turicibacter sp.]
MPCFGGFTGNIIMQDFWISMYLANMAAIAKNEADEKIKAERKDKNNKYEYQANVNTLIGSMGERLADAIFSRNPLQRIKLFLKYSSLLFLYVPTMEKLLVMRILENANFIITESLIYDSLNCG